MTNLRTKSKLLPFIALLVLCLVCSVVFSSCNMMKLGNDDFNEFCDSMLTSMLEGDGISINILLDNPAALGLENEAAELPTPAKDEDEYAKSFDGLKTIITYLKYYFDDDKLTLENRQAREVLIAYFSTLYSKKDYYYFNDSYLGSSSGWNAVLPVYLLKYSFDDKHDVDNYISLLAQTETVFPEYVAFEQRRIDAGFGRADVTYRGIVEQCNTFAKEDANSDDDNLLIAPFNARIDACSFLNADEKTAYKTQMLSTLKTKTLPAYRKLAVDVLKFVGLEGNNNQGLYYYKGGADYYEYAFEDATSQADVVSVAYQKLIDAYNQTVTDYNTLRNSLASTLGSVESVNDALDALEASADLSVEAIEAQYQSISTAAAADFPSLYSSTPAPTFTAIDEALKDNYAPASYFLSAIDNNQAQETIFINEYTSSNYIGYELISHEGYPGHMLQHSYFKNYTLQPVRNVLSFSGYAEGWGEYAQTYTAKYYKSGVDNDIYRLYTLNMKLQGYSVSLADISVNYYGYTKAQLQTYFESLYSSDVADYSSNIYDFVVENPTNYPCYFYGLYKMETLRNSFDGTDLEFHTAVLKAGPMTFELLEKYI